MEVEEVKEEEAGGGRKKRGKAEGTEKGKYATGMLCILQSLEYSSLVLYLPSPDLHKLSLFKSLNFVTSSTLTI